MLMKRMQTTRRLEAEPVAHGSQCNSAHSAPRVMPPHRARARVLCRLEERLLSWAPLLVAAQQVLH